MAKDDVDLDGFDLDDFNFDTPEFSVEEDKGDSRTPVNRAVRGAVKGVKDEIASKQGIQKALTMALPEGYGLAGDTLKGVATNTRALYDRITGESPELVAGSKKFSRRAMALVGDKVLPKKVSKRINDALEDAGNEPVKSAAAYAREQEESDIAQLAEIFKAQAAGDMARDEQDAVDKVENKALEQARFKSNIQALTAMNRSMARLVGYQDRVTARYQQKMLELNYRQVATSKQLLDTFTISSQKQEAILENIRKNTALPEAVKIRKSEMFGQMAKQRLIGNGLNTISNWTQNYTQQLMNNVNGLVQGVMSPISMAQGMGGEDLDKAALGGQVVGSMIGSELRDRASMAVSPWLSKNKHIARGNEWLRGKFSGIPQKVNEWANTREEGTGYKATGMQMLKDFLPKFILDSRAGGERVEELDDIANFDKVSRRTLIEVIPGYLSEIAHWSKVAVTGEKDSEKKVYNLVRGGFTSQKEQLRDVSRQVMPRQEREALRLASDEFVAEIGGDTLSPKAQRVLKRKLLDELANGRDLVPARLVQRDQYPGDDPSAVDEVVSLIADTFNLDPETGEDLDNSTASKKRFNDVADQYRRMSSLIPAVGDRVRIFSDMLGKDSMRELGFIERDKNGREDRVNFNRFWEMLLDNEDEDKGSSGTQKGSPTNPNRGDGNSNRLGGANKIDDLIADSADRADERTAGSKQSGGRVRGLERYLGDKSTLITILRETRDLNVSAVAFLKELASGGICCDGQGGGSSALKEASASVGEYYKRMKDSTTSAWKRTKDYGKNTLLPGMENAKNTAVDMWIQGEDHPVLQEWKLKAGHYRDKATDTAIKSWDQISGDVIDIKNGAVVRYNDLVATGVFADAKGKIIGKAKDKFNAFRMSGAGQKTSEVVSYTKGKISDLGNKVNELRGDGSLTSFADNLGNDIYDKGSRVVNSGKRRFGKLMKFFTGGKAGADISNELTGDSKEDMVTLTMRMVQLQYETLKQVTPEKIRKGSMQDIWSRRKDITNNAKEKVKGAYENAQGMMAKGGLLANLVERLSGNGDEEGGGDGDTYIDMGGDGGDDKKKRGRGKNKPGKPRGRFGRAWDWSKGKMSRGLDKLGLFGKTVKLGARATAGAAKGAWWLTKNVGKGLWGATKFAGRVLGSQGLRTAAAFAGRMALGAIVGAAGLVSAPVLAGAAIIGTGIAVGTYIYGATRDRLPNMAKARYVQYGVKPIAESKYVAQIAALEKKASSLATVNDGAATMDIAKLTIEDFKEVFGVEMTEGEDPNDNEHFVRIVKFVSGRFKEVYLKHLAVLHSMTKSTDVNKADQLITGKAKINFLNSTSLADKKDIFEQMDAPFEDEDDLDYDWDDVRDELEAIKRDVAKEVDKEEGANKGTTASAQHAAAATMAMAAGAEASKSSSKPEEDKSAETSKAPSMVKAVDTNKTTSANVSKAAFAGAGAAVLAPMAIAAARNENSGIIDDGKAVRYRVYGLTEMLASKVAHLETLENVLFDKVSYDKDKVATFSDMEEAHRVAEGIFSPLGDKEVDNVYVWFYRRFAPAFLTYCTQVRMRANIDARDASMKLSAADLLDVLRSTADARDQGGSLVWIIDNSPWKGYLLNFDPNSVKEPLHQLQLKIKDKVLKDPTTANAGRKRGPNGELEDVDPTQVNRPTEDNSSGFFSDLGKGIADSAKSAWGKLTSFFGGGDKSPQQGAISSTGQNAAPGYGAGATGPNEIPQGPPVNHPGGGTGGDVNNIPKPEGKGWPESRKTLMTAANMVGVDPVLAGSVAGVESGYNPDAIPFWDGKIQSSARSYYQVTNDTWDELMGKYAKKYGIHPDTRQTDPRANALLGLEYIRENIDKLKSVVGGRDVRDTDVYLAHFLGPNGAKRFLRAPPGAPAKDHVQSSQVNSNRPIFFDSQGRPRTVAAVYGDFDNKMKAFRKPDAVEVAAAMRGMQQSGGGELTAENGTGVGDSPSGETTSAPEVPLLLRPMGSDTSMVKATDTSMPTNTVAEADTASTPVSTATETAETRQVQNTVAPLQNIAYRAETQSAPQVAAQTETYGGADKMGRLVSVNEQQLQQLINIANLMAKGGTGLNAGPMQADAGGKPTTVNSNLKVPQKLPADIASASRV